MKVRGLAALCGVGAAAALVGWANAQLEAPEIVEATSLARDAFSTGTLTPADGALPANLWSGANTETLEFLLLQAPARPATPAIGEALRRTLLSPGAAPSGAAPSLGGKKLLSLARAGFLEEASTVASISDAGRGDPWTGQALAISDLLQGDTGRACQRNAGLTSGRDELFWVKLRVLCYANADELDAADLTLNILREQGALTPEDDIFLTAVATGAAPKSPPAPQSVLQYAVAKKLKLPLAPDLLKRADGGVLVAVARDQSIDVATRVSAARLAVAMGVFPVTEFRALVDGVTLEPSEINGAVTAAQEKPFDPLTDVALFHSVKALSAPEFLRDKAQRIALALSLADTFPRSYALANLYADEIASLEGAIVTASEAELFAAARMATGDSVGAGQWLLAMLGGSESVSALSEEMGLAFIDHVNLLAVLDPQTAAQVARTAGVSVLAGATGYGQTTGGGDPELAAQILDAAFDAAIEGKPGQAGLAAIAASVGGDDADIGGLNAVIVGQSLRVAGLEGLRRRHEFEMAWAASFPGETNPLSVGDDGGEIEETPSDQGLTPRLKPAAN